MTTSKNSITNKEKLIVSLFDLTAGVGSSIHYIEHVCHMHIILSVKLFLMNEQNKSRSIFLCTHVMVLSRQGPADSCACHPGL